MFFWILHAATIQYCLCLFLFCEFFRSQDHPSHPYLHYGWEGYNNVFTLHYDLVKNLGWCYNSCIGFFTLLWVLARICMFHYITVWYLRPYILSHNRNFFHSVNKWISELIANATEKMMKQKDERYSVLFLVHFSIFSLQGRGWILVVDHFTFVLFSPFYHLFSALFSP